MNETESWRLDNLRRADVTAEFLEELHGITWPLEGELAIDFKGWVETLPRPPHLTHESAPRFHIERFLETRELQSLRYAASTLGVKQESLRHLLRQLPQLGLRKTYEVYSNLIDKSLAEDLTRVLPGLRFKTFGTHDSFCELLHGILKDKFGIDVEPQYCATAERMATNQNASRLYASTWDNITMEPLSVRHSVWLDLGKPLSLPPDRCSKLFYAEYREELQGCLAGRGEPRDLDDYLRFLETCTHE